MRLRMKCAYILVFSHCGVCREYAGERGDCGGGERTRNMKFKWFYSTENFHRFSCSHTLLYWDTESYHFIYNNVHCWVEKLKTPSRKIIKTKKLILCWTQLGAVCCASWDVVKVNHYYHLRLLHCWEYSPPLTLELYNPITRDFISQFRIFLEIIQMNRWARKDSFFINFPPILSLWNTISQSI